MPQFIGDLHWAYLREKGALCFETRIRRKRARSTSAHGPMTRAPRSSREKREDRVQTHLLCPKIVFLPGMEPSTFLSDSQLLAGASTGLRPPSGTLLRPGFGTSFKALPKKLRIT